MIDSKLFELIETMTFITTHDNRRRAMWLRLFGTDSLPVKSAVPRMQVVRGEWGETVRLAFDLDASRLHWMAVQRFADYLTEKHNYPVTSSQVDGYPIRAGGCEVVDIECGETVGTSMWVKRPFSFVGDRFSYA